MVRKLSRVALAGAMGALAVVLSVNGTMTQAEDKVPAVNEIMKKSFGKGGYKASITAAAKDGKWEEAQKLAKEWNELGKVIGKNKPNKNEGKAWEEQCTKFAENTKAVLKATEDKDAKAVSKGVGSFNCKACHDSHK